MVILWWIIGIILALGIIRVIATPRHGFWQTLLEITWLDLLFDLILSIVENIDDWD
jgi:hypothetical protein